MPFDYEIYDIDKELWTIIRDIPKGYYNMLLVLWKIYDIDEIGSKGSIPVPFY